MPKAPRIFVVEDDESIRMLLEVALRSSGYTVSAFPNAADALAEMENTVPDAAVLDIMLDGMDGITALKLMRANARLAGVPVMMLTAKDSETDKIIGLDAGADDYLAKPFEPQELLARVRALARRSQHGGLSPVIVHGSLECHVKARTAYRNGRHVPLSPREFDLFHYLMRNAGEIVTREMLLANVWHLNFDPQTNVVDVGVGRLRRKLEDAGDGPVLSTIWGTGYRLQDA